MNRGIFLLLVGIAAAFGGCTLAPKYVRPQAPVPVTWPSGPAYKATFANTNGPAAADMPWREFFANASFRK